MESDDKESTIRALNGVLPPTIRIFDMQRVTFGFSARLYCSSRHYEYLLPTVALRDVKLSLPLASKPRRTLSHADKQALLARLKAAEAGAAVASNAPSAGQLPMAASGTGDTPEPAREDTGALEKAYAARIQSIQQDPFANGSALLRGTREQTAGSLCWPWAGAGPELLAGPGAMSVGKSSASEPKPEIKAAVSVSVPALSGAGGADE